MGKEGWAYFAYRAEDLSVFLLVAGYDFKSLPVRIIHLHRAYGVFGFKLCHFRQFATTQGAEWITIQLTYSSRKLATMNIFAGQSESGP